MLELITGGKKELSEHSKDEIDRLAQMYVNVMLNVVQELGEKDGTDEEFAKAHGVFITEYTKAVVKHFPEL